MGIQTLTQKRLFAVRFQCLSLFFNHRNIYLIEHETNPKMKEGNELHVPSTITPNIPK